MTNNYLQKITHKTKEFNVVTTFYIFTLKLTTDFDKVQISINERKFLLKCPDLLMWLNEDRDINNIDYG
jgi:hypothetical protein